MKRKKVTVNKPYIEFDLDAQKIVLVFPEQHFVNNIKIDENLFYELKINDIEEKLPINFEKMDDILIIKKKTHKIDEPIEKLSIKFPGIFNFNELDYKHRDKDIYIFTSHSGKKFRMHYLFNAFSSINPIPRKDIWVLLNNDCNFISEPNNTMEIWFWENYKPAFFKLKEINELIFQKTSDIHIEIPYENNFILEGSIVKDGLYDESPLFTGNIAFLKSKYENLDGWNVWVQNKQIGKDKLINDNWFGSEALEIKFADMLPYIFGEFQLSICSKNSRKPIDTIFFRYIESILIQYNDSLILPTIEGHKDEEIHIKFKKELRDWRIITRDICEKINEGYKLIIKEKDIAEFNIANIKYPKIRLPIRIRIPKLIWKLSDSKIFTDKVIDLNRDNIILNQNLLLNAYINTDTSYDMEAVLLQNSRELQILNLKKNKKIYSCLLSQFIDTIAINKSTLNLLLRIYINKKFLAEICILKILFKDIICRLCKKEENFQEMKDFHRHLFMKHWPDIVKTLQYDEIRMYNPSLPVAIYKCSFCKQFFKATNPENPRSFVEYHITHRCEIAKNKRNNLPIEKCYIEVLDIDTIKKNVYTKLTKLYICKICNKIPRDKDSKDNNLKAMLKHFYKDHPELFYYK